MAIKFRELTKLASNKDSAHACIGTYITVDSYNFGVVRDFGCVGTWINTDNNESHEIQLRISLAKKCYVGLSRQLRSKALSRRKETQFF